jgi:predicted GNAT superfamily acetyltransferase
MLHKLDTTMDIVIKVLNSFKQFEEIAELQEKIWNLSDLDKISTITLKAITMRYPMMGMILGAYHQSKIIGFVICLPTREPATMYGLIMGILPEYQNSDVGNQMGIKILEIGKKEDIAKISWTFEPLESALGHLYLNKWGAVVVRYEKDYYQLKNEYNKNYPLDRFIVDCNLQSPRVVEKISKKIKMHSLAEALKEFPLTKSNFFPNEKAVLVKIPSNFNKLKNDDYKEALEQRYVTRSIFEEYINKRTYFIAELISEELDGERQNYYLLEKRSYI